ncbi:MAG: histidine kinase [Oscillospiraceae bacterium]|nr:histidine kinase [Oscillospiraceae bacterium]
MSHPERTNIRRDNNRSAAAAGAVCLVILLLLTALMQIQQNSREALQMEYIVRTVESETYETLLTQMEKTRVMEGHLIETGGDYENFGPISQRLLGEEAVRSLLFAPDGVVRGVFPLEGNEPVYGLDLNSEGAGNLEAQEAIRKGTLILAGPFELVEGGLGVCGRLPIYLENDSGQREYWGLVSVTLKYPEIFADNPIHHVNEQGFACRVWRINPDDNREQTILETEKPIGNRTGIREYRTTMFNTTWTISVAPLIPWYLRPSLWLCIAGSVMVSLLALFGVSTAVKLRRMKAEASQMQIRELQQKLEQERASLMLSQISSHFFYHTLNALQALIVLNPDAAYRMAGDFSRYLRFNTDAILLADGIVSFKEELRAVRAYAHINEQMLGERLKVNFDIPEEDFSIPALTVQPIVENAILHGIKPKVGGGTVTVRLTEDETHWHITVTDDGMGFDPTEQVMNRSVGLSNVRKRIEHFAGCSMDVKSTVGQGTEISLHYHKILQKIK